VKLVRLLLALLILLIPLPAAAADKTPIILIHGGWGSGQGWWKVKPLLEKEGFKVFAPSLPGQGDKASQGGPGVNLTTHVDAIVRLIEREKLDHVVLVGHSLGGMVVSGVAERIPDRIARLVYVDAFLPENGESAFDLMAPAYAATLRKRAAEQGNGWAVAPSGGKGPPMPIGTLEEKIRLVNPAAAAIAGTYILTIDPGMKVDAFSGSAMRARRKIWPVYMLQTGHLPQVTMPDKLSELLVQAALASQPY
jgi:pimeloyl-ACP methyl ester carboxylesterase